MNNNNDSTTDLELSQFLQEPFTDTDDPDFFYPEHTRIQRLRLLLHLTSLDDLLLIIGQPGAGKTMLLKQFLLQAKETASVNLIDVHDIKNEIQFITTIADTLGLELTEKEPEQSLKNQLLDAISDLQQTALRTILAIDNIHKLDIKSLQCIEAITHHTQEHEKALHIVMAGNLEIQQILEQPELKKLKQSILHTFEVPPFDEHQTKEYILHRLHAANYHDHSLFTPAEIKRIYKKSEGLPERINALARQTIGPQEQHPLFSAAPTISLETITEELQEKKPSLSSPSSFVQQFKSMWSSNKFIPALLLVSIAAFIFFLQSTISSYFAEDPTNQRTETLNLPVIEKQIEPPKFVAQTEKPANNDVQPEVPQPTTRPTPITTPQVSSEKVPKEKQKAIEIVPPPLEQAVTIEPKITKKLEQKVSAVHSPAPPPAPKAEQTAMAPATPPTIKNRKWINKQNKEHYTLQVFAISKEDAMRDFIQKNQLTNQSAYLRFERNGANLYAMLYGSYESRDLASKAINSLPTSLASFKPWIRSYGSIQESIKNTP